LQETIYLMKTTFIVILVALSICFVGFKVQHWFVSKKALNMEKDKFMSNIKSGKKSFDADNWMSRNNVMDYSMNDLNKSIVIDVQSGKEYLAKNVLNSSNTFINFWFKGCGGCEVEMPEIQQFYEKYNNKIQFLILSNDSLETVRRYIKKEGFTLPFYVFKNSGFPGHIDVFPTNPLIINNKTAFLYAGIGYFDNKDFYRYVDSILVSK
jgi:thiol-disulfide isomerase/thioredoxin